MERLKTKGEQSELKYKWPNSSDELWVQFEDIVCVVNEPTPIGSSKRGYQISVDDHLSDKPVTVIHCCNILIYHNIIKSKFHIVQNRLLFIRIDSILYRYISVFIRLNRC
jgi:hypothetical protein